MILFKKQLFDLEVKGQGPMKVITVRDTPLYGHAPTYQISLTYLERKKSYGPDKLCWEEAEEKTRLRQYVSLRLKRRHDYQATLRGDVSFRYLKQFFLVKAMWYMSTCHITHVTITYLGYASGITIYLLFLVFL
jgi:hypothetical protein